MSSSISANTKAILLLTAPLIVGKGKSQVSNLPLPPTDYNKVARSLKEQGMEPADLLHSGDIDALCNGLSSIDPERIKRLLERGFLLSQAIEHWQARAIWVISRADDEYPKLLRKRLRDTAPPILYGCGSREILETGGLAVVGSRNAEEGALRYAEKIGRIAAKSYCTIISGVARGVDQVAMRGALRESGNVVGVMTGELERKALNHENIERLMEGQLVLISPYDPKAGFNIGNAMGRNKLIYALADAGLVVESDYNKGGTWAGAVEQLEKLRFVPVYTRSEGEISSGLKALRHKGALAWPNPETPDEFKALLSNGFSTSMEVTPKQALLIPAQTEVAETHDNQPAEQETLLTMHVEHNALEQKSAADDLFAMVEQLLKSMDVSITESDVVKHLRVEKKQAHVWLKRLVDEGKYKRIGKPKVHYVRSS